jgi:threonine/homoserine/homoserine lactone efflux protein
LTGGALGPAIAGLSIGVALASAPGPVQAVLLAEAVSGGTPRGFRAQAGANLTFAVMLVCLAFGLSAATPAGRALAVLQAAGGALLLLLAFDGLRSARQSARRSARDGQPPGRPVAGRPVAGRPVAGRLPRLPPAVRGILVVILNPGSWLFLGAVAAPLFATAIRQDGTGGALIVALVMVIGTGSGDTAVVLIGGIGVRRAGQRVQRGVRQALAVVLAGLGCWFLTAGMISLLRR